MANPRLSESVLRATVEAVRLHGSQSAAARALNLPQATVQRRYREALRVFDLPAGHQGKHSTPPPPPPIPLMDAEAPETVVYPVETPRGDFEREWREWQKAIGMATSRYSGPCKRPARQGRLKILVVPDLHAPFHERAFVATMLQRDADADVCLIMGDIGDGYSLSRFIKYERVDYEAELAAVTLLLEEFSARFPLVQVLTGNHDFPRLEKQLRDRLPPDFISAILAMTGGTLNPLEALTKRLANVEIVGHRVDRHQVAWLHQIGDAIFTHAEKFSIMPGSALRKIEEWLADNERTLGLQPWRVLVQAHTHQLSLIPWHADKVLIECGCLAQTPGYALSARIGGRPQRRGYVTLEQVDGVTDPNSIRLVWLDHPAAQGAA